MSAIMRNI